MSRGHHPDGLTGRFCSPRPTISVRQPRLDTEVAEKLVTEAIERAQVKS
jgi:hypothetical protein